jgi:hypothetical protein
VAEQTLNDSMNDSMNHSIAAINSTGVLTSEAEDWKAVWDAECPLMIGVAFSGWESGSDAALRDELKRIRDTGFGAVRVRFDRDNDIQKSLGMMNWRNPDRLFDSAEKAGLRVLAAPGNQPHSSFDPQQTEFPYSDAAIENISAWLLRFCGQYRNHSALMAWVLEEETQKAWLFREEEAQIRQRNLTRLIDAFHAADPTHPVLTTTSHLLDNANHSFLRAQHTDLFGTTLHLNDELPFDIETEADRPTYTLARLASDLAVNHSLPLITSFAAGSSRYSGTSAITLTAAKMTRLLFLLLAAGTKTVVLDTWRSEKNGTLPGENGLLDWLDRITPQAAQAGRVALAVERYHQELWHSHLAPQVQILYSWQNDRQAQMIDHQRGSRYSDHEDEPALARIGAARTLLNANIPFAFLTEQQLLEESVPVAPILFLPHIEALSDSLLVKLKEAAANGCRIVADMPTGYLNEKGELLDTRPGSAWEQLFGVSVAGLFCFSNPSVKDFEPRRGQQRAILVPTTARAAGGEPETPAFTENRVGKGRAVLINASLSRLNDMPNLPNAQLSLLSYLLGSKQTELPGISGCLMFRRRSKQAEHIFLINDSSEERTVDVPLSTPFTQAHDVLDDTPLAVENNLARVPVLAGSGRWLRLNHPLLAGES